MQCRQPVLAAPCSLRLPHPQAGAPARAAAAATAAPLRALSGRAAAPLAAAAAAARLHRAATRQAARRTLCAAAAADAETFQYQAEVSCRGVCILSWAGVDVSGAGLGAAAVARPPAPEPSPLVGACGGPWTGSFGPPLAAACVMRCYRLAARRGSGCMRAWREAGAGRRLVPPPAC